MGSLLHLASLVAGRGWNCGHRPFAFCRPRPKTTHTLWLLCTQLGSAFTALVSKTQAPQEVTPLDPCSSSALLSFCLALAPCHLTAPASPLTSCSWSSRRGRNLGEQVSVVVAVGSLQLRVVCWLFKEKKGGCSLSGPERLLHSSGVPYGVGCSSVAAAATESVNIPVCPQPMQHPLPPWPLSITEAECVTVLGAWEWAKLGGWGEGRFWLELTDTTGRLRRG